MAQAEQSSAMSWVPWPHWALVSFASTTQPTSSGREDPIKTLAFLVSHLEDAASLIKPRSPASKLDMKPHQAGYVIKVNYREQNISNGEQEASPGQLASSSVEFSVSYPHSFPEA